ncbi:MAG: hemolysin family protein, partial [Desulfobacterales bacterium]
EEKELIHNIFELDDTNVSEIMTPRTDMFVVEAEEKLRLDRIIQSGFSRIPVIEGDIDHVIGILNIKDLFMHQVTSDKEIEVRKIMTKPYFVPENKKLDNLLHQFKKIKHHLAIVVDEYGGVSGLITLEDALEEIVGEIRDETDKDEPHIVEIGNQTWRVLGKSEIEEVNENTGMNIPVSKEYDTFSGFILDKIGRIPEEKEKIMFETFVITVKEMQGNRLIEFIVKKN